jgi:hypothetical protein
MATDFVLDFRLVPKTNAKNVCKVRVHPSVVRLSVRIEHIYPPPPTGGIIFKCHFFKLKFLGYILFLVQIRRK